MGRDVGMIVLTLDHGPASAQETSSAFQMVLQQKAAKARPNAGQTMLRCFYDDLMNPHLHTSSHVLFLSSQCYVCPAAFGSAMDH